MRLKEPLFGIRAAGLHHILHLSMICTMIYIEGTSHIHNQGQILNSDQNINFNPIGFYSRAYDRAQINMN